MEYIKVIDMMHYLSKKYKTRQLAFTDNAINYSADWVKQFAEELQKRDLHLKWSVRFTPAVNVPKTLAMKLEKAGLETAIIGIESLSDKTLRKMNRPCNAKDNLKCIHSFASLPGVVTIVNLIAGFPGETDREYSQTLRSLRLLLVRYGKIYVNANMYKVASSSYCFNNPKKYGIKLIRTRSLNCPGLNEIIKNMPLYFKVSSGGNTIKRHRVLRNLAHVSMILASKYDDKSSITQARRPTLNI